MALSKTEKTKLDERLKEVETSLRNVDPSDRAPVNAAHDTITAIREDFDIEDDE